MKLHLSQEDLRRARRGQLSPALHPPRRRSHRKLIWLAFALLLVTTMLINRKGKQLKATQVAGNAGLEVQELVIGLAGKPYRDPGGLFTIIPPAPWPVHGTPETTGYNVLFRSPNGPQLGIIATPVQDDSFPQLLRDLDQKERELGIDMNLELIEFNGHRATRRRAHLHGLDVLAIDFAAQGVAHHLQYSAHPDVFERYRPAIEDVMETYVPLPAP